jgi:hypothetical protein
MIILLAAAAALANSPAPTLQTTSGHVGATAPVSAQTEPTIRTALHAGIPTALTAGWSTPLAGPLAVEFQGNLGYALVGAVAALWLRYRPQEHAGLHAGLRLGVGSMLGRDRSFEKLFGPEVYTSPFYPSWSGQLAYGWAERSALAFTLTGAWSPVPPAGRVWGSGHLGWDSRVYVVLDVAVQIDVSEGAALLVGLGLSLPWQDGITLPTSFTLGAAF